MDFAELGAHLRGVGFDRSSMLAGLDHMAQRPDAVPAMIRKMAGRVRLLHLKDYRADGGMDNVGAGTLDFPALLAAGAEAGVEHRFVEHDFPPEPYWPSVEASLGYLRGRG